MSKTKLTESLEEAIFRATKKIGVFSCFEVTIGNGGSERVDFLTFDTKGIWRCFEIKSSVSDFRSSAKKTFVGHYNYYVLTPEVYEVVKDEIPLHIGIYQYGRCVKKAKKQVLSVDESVLEFSIIRSLSRDAGKLYQSENKKIINNYERRIQQLEKERTEHRLRYQALNREVTLKLGSRWRATEYEPIKEKL